LKSLVLFFLYLNLYATTYPTFTKNELQAIEREVSPLAIERIKKYTSTINTYKDLPKLEQLVKVNSFINKILPKCNTLFIDKKNHWTTPKEFLTYGRADCEDYAIIKYFTLLKLGFDEKKLFLTTSYDTISRQTHMVLSYFSEDNNEPLILDNLSIEVLELNKRTDLLVSLFVNANGAYKLDNQTHLMKIANGVTQFKDLLKRVEQEG